MESVYIWISVTVGVLLLLAISIYIQLYRQPVCLYQCCCRMRYVCCQPSPLSLNFTEIDEIAYIGTMPDSQDSIKKQLAEKHKVRCIITLQEDYEIHPSLFSKVAEYGILHVHKPTPDWTPLTLQDIGYCVAIMLFCVEKKARVYIHCRAGVGRSGVIAVCYYCIRYKVSPEVAEKVIKSKRPSLKANTFANWSRVAEFVTHYWKDERTRLEEEVKNSDLSLISSPTTPFSTVSSSTASFSTSAALPSTSSSVSVRSSRGRDDDEEDDSKTPLIARAI